MRRKSTSARKKPANAGVKLIRAEDVDDQHRNLLRLVGGRVQTLGQEGPQLFEPLGAFIYCERATDIANAVKLADKHGFRDRTVLVLGGECYKATIELEKAALPVVLPPELTYSERDMLTGDVTRTFVPKRIYDAGLKFALVPGPNTSLPQRMLNYQAAQCVRRGIGRDVALRAITLTPAEMLGLDKRLGSIEPGKDANLVIFSGDPLSYNSVVEKVFIAGILAYERDKDVRLKRLLAPGTKKVEENVE